MYNLYLWYFYYLYSTRYWVYYLYWVIYLLVGGFNPSEKYESQLGSLFPTEWKKCPKPPTRYLLVLSCHILWSVCKKKGTLYPMFLQFLFKKHIIFSIHIYQITSIVGVQKKTSNNQTWLKGKFRHVLDYFPSYKARESCSNLDVNHSSKWESRKIPLDPIRMDFFTEIESYYLVQSQ